MWIFLLDTAFVIFNNLPHRMVIKEMRMHMASPEPCFQATTAEECFAQIQMLMSPPTPFCSLFLREAIENLCTEEVTIETKRNLSLLGPLNLFAIVSGKRTLVVHCASGSSLTFGSIPLHDFPAAKFPGCGRAGGPHT